MKYALRVCLEHGHKEACVHIYSIMGLYEEAVGLAIEVGTDALLNVERLQRSDVFKGLRSFLAQIDINLAKSKAELPENDSDLKRKLWLKIGETSYIL